MGQVRSGPEPHPGVWRPVQGQGEGLLPWYLGRLGRNLDCVLSAWLHSQRDVFDTPHYWPDCSGKLPEQLKLGRRDTLIGTRHKKYFWAAASTSWPGCSGKRVRAPKGLLPGEIPEQLKFVTGKASY